MAAGQAPANPDGVVVKTSDFVPVFRLDAFQADVAPLPPSHPPIDQIPPMPLPNPDWDVPDNFGGPGNAVHFNQLTGEIREIPGYAEGRSDGGFGGLIYEGPDNRISWDDLYGPRNFGTMSQIAVGTINSYPWRVNCKMVLEFVDAGNGNAAYYVCSGAMQDPEVIMTAGHCVYNRDNDSTGQDYGFANRIWVYPGWDGSGLTLGTPDIINWYGWGVSTNMVTWTGWSVDGNFDWDLGLVGVDRAVGMLTGWFGWRWGGDCTSLTHNNASYPSEGCGTPGLHNGRDMYYWFGNFDSCPGNQMHLNTTAGCFTAVWGGMSGSNAYDIVGSDRYSHGPCSNSNRTTSGNYVNLWEAAKNYMEDTFKPQVRGTALDLQSLQTRYAESVITAGNQLTGGSVALPNPTNNNPGSATYPLSVRLSTNDFISASDTNLGSGSYTRDYAAMENPIPSLYNVTVPIGTPSGTYWVGVLLDSGIDANSGNNDSSYWDAHQLTVNGVADPLANSCSAPSGTFYHGDTIGVGYNVTNQGGDPSNAVTVDIYASTNTIISTGDTLLGSFNIGTFTGGQTKSGTLNVALPTNLLGNYYIGYIIGASDDVNSGNNTAYDATALTVDGRADLQADYLTSLESSVYQGGDLSIRYHVVNNGTVASGNYTVDVYASTNTTISTADTLLGSFVRPSLAVGSGSTVVTSVGIPGAINPGNYYIGMIVGAGANENHTTDNTAYDPTRVAILDCLVDFNSDGLLDLTDILAFGSLFQNQNSQVDFNHDGLWDLSDILMFIQLFQAGCP
ncbi:MAG: hypothetical protein H6810_04915 [Phycisphaeraceae bacterium]|nr:MAG: hypothetical protein H6810_04915 [Phycisphaeraceae bacterium]